MIRRECSKCGQVFLEDWRVACPRDGQHLKRVEELPVQEDAPAAEVTRPAQSTDAPSGSAELDA